MIRLLKVNVQPIFADDDGEDLRELAVQPVTLTAAEWRALDASTWTKDAIAQIESQLEKSPPTGVG
jgi:hypothetical protein